MAWRVASYQAEGVNGYNVSARIRSRMIVDHYYRHVPAPDDGGRLEDAWNSTTFMQISIFFIVIKGTDARPFHLGTPK